MTFLAVLGKSRTRTASLIFSAFSILTKVIFTFSIITISITTGCPEKNEPQFLLNISGYKHARKLGFIGKVGSMASSGVQKLLCTIFGSRDISKLKWGIRFQNVSILDNLIVLKSVVPYCFTFVSAPLY